MGSSNSDIQQKIVVDSIHGDIRLTAQEWDVVDTASFQRLRQLKQLGMGQVTYPNATHTRFAHSLGVLGIMIRILEVARKNGLDLQEEDREDLRLAALLHDVGHYPYSHLMERVDKVRLTEEQVDSPGDAPNILNMSKIPYPNHEKVGTLIVTHQPDLLAAIGGVERAERIAALFSRSTTANPQLSKLIHSSFDMDRLDYLLRDSRAAGVPYGQIDINYLLNNLRMSKTGMLGVTAKAITAAEHFLLARFFMHKAVYYHKTTFAIEEACRQLLRRVRDLGAYAIVRDGADVERRVKSSAELTSFTDAYVDDIVRQATSHQDRVVAALAKSVQNRRPPKLLREISLFENVNIKHNAVSAFKQNCRHKLTKLAADFAIPLGQFLLAEIKPFQLEERAAMLTIEEARKLPPEERDELIKVFVDGDPEPKSIVDIDHSLLKVCSGYAFQCARLYVVYDESDQKSKIKKMRDEVAHW